MRTNRAKHNLPPQLIASLSQPRDSLSRVNSLYCQTQQLYSDIGPIQVGLGFVLVLGFVLGLVLGLRLVSGFVLGLVLVLALRLVSRFVLGLVSVLVLRFALGFGLVLV